MTSRETEQWARNIAAAARGLEALDAFIKLARAARSVEGRVDAPLAATGLTAPFLLLDDFRSEDPVRYLAGFPWHPHRGIETITHVLGGSVDHGDTMGNRGVIGPGDTQ